MKCSVCGGNLLIANNRMFTELNSLDIYSESTLVCPNKKCKIYCGPDMNNPEFIAQKITNKV